MPTKQLLQTSVQTAISCGFNVQSSNQKESYLSTNDSSLQEISYIEATQCPLNRDQNQDERTNFPRDQNEKSLSSERPNCSL